MMHWFMNDKIEYLDYPHLENGFIENKVRVVISNGLIEQADHRIFHWAIGKPFEQLKEWWEQNRVKHLIPKEVVLTDEQIRLRKHYDTINEMHRKFCELYDKRALQEDMPVEMNFSGMGNNYYKR